MSSKSTTQRPAAASATPTIEAATFEEIGRRFVDFVRAEREHRRITAEDPSRTISFRSEETRALRHAEARARELPDRLLDEEERVERERIEAERKAAEEQEQVQ